MLLKWRKRANSNMNCEKELEYCGERLTTVLSDYSSVDTVRYLSLSFSVVMVYLSNVFNVFFWSWFMDYNTLLVR